MTIEYLDKISTDNTESSDIPENNTSCNCFQIVWNILKPSPLVWNYRRETPIQTEVSDVAAQVGYDPSNLRINNI